MSDPILVLPFAMMLGRQSYAATYSTSYHFSPESRLHVGDVVARLG